MSLRKPTYTTKHYSLTLLTTFTPSKYINKGGSNIPQEKNNPCNNNRIQENYKDENQVSALTIKYESISECIIIKQIAQEFRYNQTAET